jgi:hypothetical protein
MNSGNSFLPLMKNSRVSQPITSEATATRHWTFAKERPRMEPLSFNGLTMETRTKSGLLSQSGDDLIYKLTF